jgi:hypothetical protein
MNADVSSILGAVISTMISIYLLARHRLMRICVTWDVLLVSDCSVDLLRLAEAEPRSGASGANSACGSMGSRITEVGWAKMEVARRVSALGPQRGRHRGH